MSFFSAISTLIVQWWWVGALVLAAVFVREIRRVPGGERGFTLLMFGYFFLIIASFWLIKPIKKAMFVSHYNEHPGHFLGIALDPAQMELLAKEMNIIVAMLAVYGLTFVSGKLSHIRLAISYTLVMALCLGIFIIVLPSDNPGLIWVFYLFADLMVTSFVAIFFSLLHDHCNLDTAKRVYALIGVGGVLGGFAGSALATGLEQTVGGRGVLLADLTLLAMLLALQLLFSRHRQWQGCTVVDFVLAPDRKQDWRGLLHGAGKVLESRRLRRIAIVLFIYEVVSVIMDFQFTSAVVRYLQPEDYGRHFGAVYTFSNALAILVQVLFTTWIMRHYGPKVALFVMPLVVLGASSLHMLFPLLLFASLLNTADSAFAYTIQQTARETLYVPLSRQERFEAKAFIDILWLRFSKGIAVILSLIASLYGTDGSHVWLSMIVIVLVVFWLDTVAKLAGLFETARNEGEIE